jgi:hypothetical protein
MKLCSPIQRKFIEDPSRFKLARAGRQSGKTFADAVYLILTCLKAPNTPTLYLGLTRDSAREAIWMTIVTILELLEIPHEALESTLRIKFANGSFIQLFGADALNARNRLRGRKFGLVVVDEMGFFVTADDLIKSLLPTTAILKGTLIMTSSPGLLLTGFFYEADQGNLQSSWSKYHWTIKDNPEMMKPANDPKFKTRAEEELDTICRLQFGGNVQHPTFRREYLGEWVRDATSLVYPFDQKNVIQDEYEIEKPQYGIGIDLGSVSASAICVLKFSQYSREVQVVETWKEAGLLIDQIAAQLQSFIDKYKPILTIADTGGLGKVVVEELTRRYHMQVQAAEKTDKSWHQRIIANDLISGYIKVIRPFNENLLAEWASITKDNNGDEIKGTENHASDACLYIYRRVYNTYLKNATPKPTEEDRMISSITKLAKIESRDQDDAAWDFDE